MKPRKMIFIFNLLFICLAFVGCHRNKNDVWEDTKSGTRHISRGFRTMGGKHGDSRQVQSRDQFYIDDPYADAQGDQFIPLSDMENPNEVAMGDSWTPQPYNSPGDPGSPIPSLDAFRDPATMPALSGVFRNINFEYNSHLIKGQQHLETLRNVATYLKKHPNTYVFVEGHTDERGPEAYNLALGSRRSNTVRNALIAEGVNPDNVFTISYGKERPLILESHEEAWHQNRRAEFKIYQR